MSDLASAIELILHNLKNPEARIRVVTSNGYAELGRDQQLALATALRSMPLQDHAADEREACAKVADDWLSAYGNRNPKFVDAQTWACDAVRDIADAIRQRRAMVAEQQTEAKS